MDTILVAVVIFTLIIVSVLTMTVSAFRSADSLADAWKETQAQSINIKDTEILVTGNYTGGLINVEVQNEGRTNLYDYPSWDVIIQHQSGDAFHLSRAEAYPPVNNGSWAIEGIFMADGSAEVFDPDILNPGEVMIVAINPDTVVTPETARIVISTPNGVTSQCFVTIQ